MRTALFLRLSILPLTLLASVASADSPLQVQPGDLSIIFPAADTKARLDRLITLRDLNLSNADMRAIVAHTNRELIIQSEYDFNNGRNYQRDADDEENTNPNDFRSRKCVPQLENWKVAGIRIAPFEYSLPGSKTALKQYAESKKLVGLERVFQVRLSLNPVCEEIIEGKKEIKAYDSGLHLIYNVWPSDRALRETIVSSLETYLELSEAGKHAEAQRYLSIHEQALASAPYQSHFNQLIQRLNELAAKRGAMNSNADALAKLYRAALKLPVYYLSSFNKNGDPVEYPRENARASLPLNWGEGNAFANEAYFEAVKDFTKSVVKKENMVRVALNVLEGGDSWTLVGLLSTSKFREGVFGASDNEKAKKVFATLFPQELKTYQAVTVSGKLQIRTVSTSGYYASLDILGLQNKKDQQRGVTIFDKKLFAGIDFYSDVLNDEYVLLPTPAKDERIPLSKLLNSPNTINATTTSCTTCHVLPVITGSGSHKKGFNEDITFAFSLEPQHVVRMMGFDVNNSPVIRSMTVNEVADDMKKLTDYMSGKK